MNNYDKLNLRIQFTKFSLYESTDFVYSLHDAYMEQDHLRAICLGYEKEKHRSGTHLDINILDNTAYLCSIKLAQQHRGKGIGYELYLLAESIAREFNCFTIEQSASGQTIHGEKRIDYLTRKLGYTQISEMVASKELV